MILSNHAEQRFNQRIAMPKSKLLYRVESLLHFEFVSIRPPKWYLGKNAAKNGNTWVEFRDSDGIECAALCDKSSGNVVTIVKKHV